MGQGVIASRVKDDAFMQGVICPRCNVRKREGLTRKFNVIALIMLIILCFMGALFD